MSDKFYFTVTDLARMMNKSPVTVRSWERKGLISLPRDSGGDRKMSIEDVKHTATIAKQLGRIPESRLELIVSALTLLSYIEKENKK
jgi:DNA-binding transcriptional MerR regulator